MLLYPVRQSQVHHTNEFRNTHRVAPKVFCCNDYEGDDIGELVETTTVTVEALAEFG